MAPDQPFYGVEAERLSGKDVSFDTFEQMAAHYAERIKSIQPDGSYKLGGASFGGTLAFEMARQLVAQGDQVALLVLIDSTAVWQPRPYASKLQPVFLVPFFKNLPLWLKSTRTIGRGQLLQRLKRKLRRRRSHHGQQSAADVLDYGGELSADRQHLIIENLTLLNAYKPEPFAGNILYVRAQTRSLLSPHDKLAGWQHLFTGQAMVCDIPGSHEGMFREPNVNLLAQQLRLHLR